MAKGKSSSSSGKNKRPNRSQSKRKNTPRRRPPEGMSQEKFDRLVAESQAPYKGLRKFIYASFGASSAIGGFVFFTKILAGRDLAQSLPNLALQLGVVALMVFLFRWEDRNKEE